MRRFVVPALVASLLITACQASPQASPAPGLGGAASSLPALGTTRIELTPTYVAGAVRRLPAVVAPHTAASINHMVVKLFHWDGTSETYLAETDVPAASLTNTITFNNLKNDETYRIRAYAYKTAGLGDQISIDASSYVTLAVATDDRPTLGNLVVTLTDVVFAGEATTGGLSVTPGTITNSGAQTVSLNLPATFTAVDTLAGNGTAAFLDGTGTAARFDSPSGVAVDAQGNVYVGDRVNRRIRKITPGGVVTTIAGSGAAGSADGTGAAATFNDPQGVAVDRNGNVFVADTGNHRIRRITPGGVVTTLAGSSLGFAEGTGAAAQFNKLAGLAVGADGNLYVADTDNHRIRRVTPAGVVSTFAGSGVAGGANASGSSAELDQPTAIAVDKFGNLFVGEFAGHRIRKITPAAAVSTYAGTGAIGSANGPAASATFNATWGIALDHAGTVFVADADNDVIRTITPDGTVSTLAGTVGVFGFQDGALATAKFWNMRGLAFAGSGQLYVADASGCRIRVLTP